MTAILKALGTLRLTTARHFALSSVLRKQLAAWALVRLVALLLVASPLWVTMSSGHLIIMGRDCTSLAREVGISYYLGLFFNEMYGWVWLFVGLPFLIGAVLTPLAQSFLPSETLWIRLSSPSCTDLVGRRLSFVASALLMTSAADAVWIFVVKRAVRNVDLSVLLHVAASFFGTLIWACGIVIAVGSIVGVAQRGATSLAVLAVFLPFVSGLVWWAWLRDVPSLFANSFPVGAPFLGGLLVHWEHHLVEVSLGLILTLCQLLTLRVSYARYR